MILADRQIAHNLQIIQQHVQQHLFQEHRAASAKKLSMIIIGNIYPIIILSKNLADSKQNCLQMPDFQHFPSVSMSLGYFTKEVHILTLIL